jgi:uncharacterized delta-60 repeat protein
MSYRTSPFTRKIRQARRPILEALEGRSLLSTAGTPDSSYGVQGYASIQYPSSPYPYDNLTAETIQSDGKAVVVGLSVDDTSNVLGAIAVSRLNSDGSADPTFGQKGVVILPGPGQSTPFELSGVAVAIQADGKIVVVSDQAGIDTQTIQIKIDRLNTDGTLDTTFGTGGVVSFQFMQGSTALSSQATSLAIEAGGQIVVGGNASARASGIFDLALARFNADGSPDSTFGTQGQVLIAQGTVSSGNAQSLQPGLAGLAIQADGAIDYDTTVAPTSGPGSLIAVRQLTASGSADPTFGTESQVLLGSTEVAGPLTIQPDGKLIVAGSDYDLTGVSAASSLDAYRLDADGTVDATFGVAGDANFEKSDVNEYHSEIDAVLVQPDGKIVLSGSYLDAGISQPLVARLDADGSIDLSFGGGSGTDLLPASLLTNDSEGEDNGGVDGLAIQADGKILAATNGGVTRLLTTGASNDFDDDGTTDQAVLLTNLAVPVFAYQPSSAPSGSPATYDLIGIPGAGQTLPAPGAYDGSGIDELGVYLPALGAFAVKPIGDTSNTGAGDYIDYIGPTGIGNAIPAPADYTGSGYTEVGVYDTVTGSFIYSTAQPSNVLAASNASSQVTVPFGIPGAGQSIPVPADYYGTGQDDIAVYLAASGVWAIQDPTGKTAGEEIAFGPQGIGNAIPAPADYDNSGHIELGLYLPSIGAFAYLPYNGGPAVITAFGMPGAGNSIPMPGDYDGSGHTELAVYMPSLDAFAYRPYDGGPDVIEAFGAVGASIPFSDAGAQAFAGTGGGGDNGIAPKAIATGGLDGYVDFVPDLASQPKKAPSGSSTTQS